MVGRGRIGAILPMIRAHVILPVAVGSAIALIPLPCGSHDGRLLPIGREGGGNGVMNGRRGCVREMDVLRPHPPLVPRGICGVVVAARFVRFQKGEGCWGSLQLDSSARSRRLIVKVDRSEEHTSELQSRFGISYAA